MLRLRSIQEIYLTQIELNKLNINPVELMDYIEALETSLGKKAEKELLPLQPGDVPDTYADVDDLVEQFGYKPSMSVKQGVENFAVWYKKYNNL